MKGNHADLAHVLPEQASALKREQKALVRAQFRLRTPDPLPELGGYVEKG